jgi:hypothetical protein
MIKKSAIRAIRKTAHLTNRASSWAAHFSNRVEHKTSRIISGTDSSFGAVSSSPFEKLYHLYAPEIVPLHPSLPQRGRKPAVVLLIPSLQKSSFFGGTSTAIITAALLAKKLSLDLRVIETLKHGGEMNLSAFLKSAGIDFKGKITQIDVTGRGYNVYGYIDMHPEDVHMASAWWDAYLLDELPLKRKFVYLIQDYEPIFYNNSDKYALAESTYHSKNYVALCNTKLMHTFMTNRGFSQVKQGSWFEPAVAYDAKALKTTTKKPASGKRRMFIYGRPNVERNLFFTAFSSLDRCFSDKHLDPSEWEVYMAGQDKVPDLELSSGVVVKSLGKMEFADYQKFISSIDVAVSLMMAPHPNYPTLEFAAKGAAVVTTRYDVKQDLSHYSKNIVMADITVDSICGALRQAASFDAETRHKNAEASTIPHTWKQTLDKPLDAIVKKIQ